jgi:guanyl-specific ribonuclease Sa
MRGPTLLGTGNLSGNPNGKFSAFLSYITCESGAPSMRTLRILSTVACALLAVTLLVAVGQAAPRRHAANARKSTHARALGTKATTHATFRAPGSAGMVVSVDPATGQVRMPTPEELQSLYVQVDDPLNYSSEGLTFTTSPKGGVMVDVQGRFREYSVARVGADGRIVLGCGDSPSRAIAGTFEPNRPSGVLEVK